MKKEDFIEAAKELLLGDGPNLIDVERPNELYCCLPPYLSELQEKILIDWIDSLKPTVKVKEYVKNFFEDLVNEGFLLTSQEVLQARIKFLEKKDHPAATEKNALKLSVAKLEATFNKLRNRTFVTNSTLIEWIDEAAKSVWDANKDYADGLKKKIKPQAYIPLCSFLCHFEDYFVVMGVSILNSKKSTILFKVSTSYWRNNCREKQEIEVEISEAQLKDCLQKYIQHQPFVLTLFDWKFEKGYWKQIERRIDGSADFGGALSIIKAFVKEKRSV